MSKFSEKAKYLREKKELTTRKLSEHLGISCSQICKYENGKNDPSLKALQAYAKFFRVTYDSLCEENEEIRI